jgi:hypothetical protein
MVVRGWACLAAALLLVALAGCEQQATPGSGSGDASPGVLAETATATRLSTPPFASPPAVQTMTLTGASAGTSGPGAYRYRVEYPQIGGPPVLVRSINAAIQGTLQRQVNDFVAAARVSTATAAVSELACSSRTVRVTPRLAVLRTDCTRHLAGDPGPTSLVDTFNVDLTRGRLLALQDLFSAGSRYLTVLSDESRQQLRSSLPGADDAALQAGTGPAVDDFVAFLLERDALVIVFAQYRPAAGPAGEAGPPEVSIPYPHLERYFAAATIDLLA